MSQKLIKRYTSLVGFFESQSEAARQLNVKQPSVNAWLTGKAQMSAISAQRAEIVTKGKFKAVDLCPLLAEIEKLKTPSGN